MNLILILKYSPSNFKFASIYSIKGEKDINKNLVFYGQMGLGFSFGRNNFHFNFIPIIKIPITRWAIQFAINSEFYFRTNNFYSILNIYLPIYQNNFNIQNIINLTLA